MLLKEMPSNLRVYNSCVSHVGLPSIVDDSPYESHACRLAVMRDAPWSELKHAYRTHIRSVHHKNKLNKCLGNIYPNVEFRFVFKSIKRIEYFFLFKDCVSSHLRWSVVYKFTCSSCKATYYGKASRHFIVCCRERYVIH